MVWLRVTIWLESGFGGTGVCCQAVLRWIYNGVRVQGLIQSSRCSLWSDTGCGQLRDPMGFRGYRCGSFCPPVMIAWP